MPRRKKSTTETHARRPENTVVSFSCSKKLAQQIRRAAQDERRTVSNWLVKELEKQLDADTH